MILIVYCLYFLVGVCRGSFWPTLSNPQSPSPILPGFGSNYIDTGTAIYPAIEAHGTVYIKEGGIVVSDGDLHINGYSLNYLRHYTNQIAAALCSDGPSVCNGPHIQYNISTCECQCQHGYTGMLCDTPICYNGGTWSILLMECICPLPYTSNSFCVDIQCGQNQILSTSGTSCVCMFPYQGAKCADINTTAVADLLLATTCFINGVNRCSDINNHGVGQCSPTLGICVCPPYYPVIGNRYIYQRIYKCAVNDLQCQARFSMLAPICCFGAASCEMTQYSTSIAPICNDISCCQIVNSQYECAFIGCWWDYDYFTCKVSPQIYNNHNALRYDNTQWILNTITCDGTAADSNLCSELAQLDQVSITSKISKDAAYHTIQSKQWPMLTTYSNWDDDIMHSIVTIIDEIPYRAALNLDGPFWSTLSWTINRAFHPEYATLFRFEVVEPPPNILAADIGSVYRIWQGSFCLLDTPLSEDQLLYLNIDTGTPMAAIMLDIGCTRYDVSIDDCGLFIIEDDSIISYDKTTLGKDGNSAAVIVHALPQSLVITTPSEIQDNSDQPVMLSPDLIAICRQRNCRIDQIRGTCTDVECAKTIVNDESIWEICIACVAAHVPFAVLGPQR